MSHYYRLQFTYTGPYSNAAEETSANKALILADKECERALSVLKWDFKHSYMWPDGSLYKYVRLDEPTANIVDRLNVEMKDFVRCKSADRLAANKSVDKAGVSTIKEYFDL